ncbi:MAG TPA: nicotinate-nucleotide adenylyltransferase [Pyrinomonadaceae bacterium]|nr:nicotinate-nucleotide adenylyltransferase [Pyrinomonadaceae bacterium]
MNGRRKRIALYGGTFDPVHVGHLAVARSLLKLFALDEVLFIPAHIAPHKRESNVTPGWHRYAMLALATQGEAGLRISTVELDAPEKPYTVETLSRLATEQGQEARLFFVMGADSWSEIMTWREWERVLMLTDHIVVTRPGYELETSHVTHAIRERLLDLRGMEQGELARAIDESEGARIYVTDAVLMDVSATGIRRAVREGRDAEWLALVPPPVAEYMKKYMLYRD